MQVTEAQFHFLVKHMMDLHKRKLDIVKAYTMDYDAYTSMLDFLNNYIKRINDLLDHAETIEHTDSLPFVILGSRVTLQGAGNSESVCISLPSDVADVSAKHAAMTVYACPTPQSEALLFKQVGERVTIKGNGQSRSLQIQKIENIAVS